MIQNLTSKMSQQKNRTTKTCGSRLGSVCGSKTDTIEKYKDYKRNNGRSS